MSIRRFCPECGERIPAGIVRHRRCYLEAVEQIQGKTERDWLKRLWGDRVSEAPPRGEVMPMYAYDID